jgi:hypothetical protein
MTADFWPALEQMLTDRERFCGEDLIRKEITNTQRQITASMCKSEYVSVGKQLIVFLIPNPPNDFFIPQETDTQHSEHPSSLFSSHSVSVSRPNPSFRPTDNNLVLPVSSHRLIPHVKHRFAVVENVCQISISCPKIVHSEQ